MVCGFVRRGLATSATLAPWTGFVWWSRVGRFVLLGGRVLVRAGFACCHTMRAEPQVQCAPRSTNVGAVCACAQAWNGRGRPNKRLPTAAVTGGGPPASQHRGGQEDFDVVCQRGPTVSVHSRGRCSADRLGDQHRQHRGGGDHPGVGRRPRRGVNGDRRAVRQPRPALSSDQRAGRGLPGTVRAGLKPSWQHLRGRRSGQRNTAAERARCDQRTRSVADRAPIDRRRRERDRRDRASRR
ncbi:PE-PGRS family protein [Mycobacterium tuberculosis]|nr:PE-PGRS family protein [Mycobacterium tuberculosis]CKU21316.1 PE-PGRS family protein [Mycobacterium tuberculosis]